MLVKEVMTKPVITIHKDKTVFEASILYRDHKIGCLVIDDDNGKCVGIVTERDLIERTICENRDPQTTLVSEIMSSDILVIHALDKVETAIEMMKEKNIKKLPVIQNDQIVGILTASDVARARPDLSKRFVESWVKSDWRD